MNTNIDNRILKSPGRYVQGPGALEQLTEYLQGMGNRLLVIISPNGKKRMEGTLQRCFKGTGYQVFYQLFQGECCQSQIDELTAFARGKCCTAVVGIGGGKILDTAKAVAYEAGLATVIIPTVASTDSPCSSLSVIYKENGEFDRYLFLNNCPELVLVDTRIIAAAPAKLLVAGMGDAMATWFEARACRQSHSLNQVAGRPTRAAEGLASLCWQHLQQDGVQAKLDAEQGICSEALENIVEVNTYLSSVGFESGGLAAAHGIQKGFTMIPELHNQYHGFKVAFCTLTQLVMEETQLGGDRIREEIRAVLHFCCEVGLPVCFADMGYTAPDPALIRLAAEKACVLGSTIHHMPFPVTPELVVQCLLKADALGEEYSQEFGIIYRSIQRIQEMENRFDYMLRANNTPPENRVYDPELRDMLFSLSMYLDSGEWQQDYEMDERGLLPASLKRGVLSQDGLYDLLDAYGILLK
ncbi:MAG: glycerol dehydrogenase [Lachnospiraceae bacterium]|nr:glycerol dehydrogenase [Lachnospiraceae bacterium]